MSEWFDSIEKLVSSEPQDGTGRLGLLEQMDAAISSGRDAAEQESAIAQLGAYLERTPGAWAARYARARLREEVGEPAAVRGYVRVAQELVQQGAVEAARHALRRATPLPGGTEAIPVLLGLGEKLGPDARGEDLRLAASVAPSHPAVFWARAQASGSAELAVKAARSFLEHGEPQQAEETLLLALEAPTGTIAREVLELIPLVLQHGAESAVEDALDLLEEICEEQRLWQVVADALERALSAAAGGAGLRRRYVEAVARVRSEAETVRTAAEEAQLLNAEVPFTQACAVFQKALSFARGALVRHSSWGVGRILAANESAMVVDFPEHPKHRMARGMAERSLRPIPPHSLEAQWHLQREELEREREEDPVGLLLRVIDEAGGKAEAAALKQTLAGRIVPEGEWSSWWKRARALAAEDPRIDHTQAFQGHYRRADGAERTVQLPPLRRQQGLGAAVRMIRRLLEQHPEAVESARAQYGPIVREWVISESNAEARALAALLLGDWHPEERERWAAVAAEALRKARSVNVLTNAPDQEAVLELAAESAQGEAALVAGLGSRYAQVRERVEQRLAGEGERLAEILWPHLGSTQSTPAVQVAAAGLLLQSDTDWAEDYDPWAVLLTLLRSLLELRAQRDLGAVKRLLAPQGRLAALLRDRPCPGALELAIEETLAELGSQAAKAEMARALLEACEHGSYVQYLEPRPERTGTQVIPERDTGVILMTRATYAQKQARKTQLERELATEIPAVIAAARELGDLSENADYHAARERQGLAAAEVRSLEAILERTKLIEDLEPSGKRVAAGTEVELREIPSGKSRSVWILGQDDGDHGPEVINYRAALAQALLEHRVGDRVSVVTDGSETTWEIVSVRRRLPEE